MADTGRRGTESGEAGRILRHAGGGAEGKKKKERGKAAPSDEQKKGGPSGPPFLFRWPILPESVDSCAIHPPRCDQNFTRAPKRIAHSEPFRFTPSVGAVTRVPLRLANWYWVQAAVAQVTFTSVP